MNCPKCGNENPITTCKDHIPCSSCKDTIVIKYYICTECSYSFRSANDEFIDGVSPDDINLSDIEHVLNDLMGGFGMCDCGDEDGCESCHSHGNDSILDSLFSCVKCGKSILLDPSETEYKCPHCGFEWEILENE